jgi:hypothetical protein
MGHTPPGRGGEGRGGTYPLAMKALEDVGVALGEADLIPRLPLGDAIVVESENMIRCRIRLWGCWGQRPARRRITQKNGGTCMYK